MDSLRPSDGTGNIDLSRDCTLHPQFSSRLQSPQSREADSMEVDSLTVRTSPKNAATAKMMYDMPAQALDKAMDGILGGEEPTLRSSTANKVGAKKVKEPKLIIPDYEKEPSEYFLFLVNEIRYEKFANDVQALNPEFVKRSDMDFVWCKTLRFHHSQWDDKTLPSFAKKKLLSQGNSQTAGYEGFDPKAYWEFQKVTNSLEDMSFLVKEPKPKKNAHFKAMQEARLRKRAERRLAVKLSREKRSKGGDNAMEI